MRGRLRDARQEGAVAAYGRAMFGADDVTLEATRNDAVPDGWPVRVLAGLEALSKLDHGAVAVTPTAMRLEGRTGNRGAVAEIGRLLSDKLGDGADFDVAVIYDELLDPTLNIPTGPECEVRLAEVQQGGQAGLRAGRAGHRRGQRRGAGRPHGRAARLQARGLRGGGPYRQPGPARS